MLFLVVLTVLFNGRGIGLIMWVGFLFAEHEQIFTDIVFKYNFKCSIIVFILLITYDIIVIFMDLSLFRLLFATSIAIMFSKIRIPNVQELLKIDISYICYIIHFPIILSFTGFVISKASIHCVFENILYPLLPTLCLCLLSAELINHIYNNILLINKYKYEH